MPELEARAAALAEDNGALGEALRDAQRELTEAGARRGEAEAELRSEADALRARADASADDLRRAREEANAHKLGALAAAAKVAALEEALAVAPEVAAAAAPELREVSAQAAAGTSAAALLLTKAEHAMQALEARLAGADLDALERQDDARQEAEAELEAAREEAAALRRRAEAEKPKIASLHSTINALTEEVRATQALNAELREQARAAAERENAALVHAQGLEAGAERKAAAEAELAAALAAEEARSRSLEAELLRAGAQGADGVESFALKEALEKVLRLEKANAELRAKEKERKKVLEYSKRFLQDAMSAEEQQ